MSLRLEIDSGRMSSELMRRGTLALASALDAAGGGG
jgi:hypothetical protein